jgi:hypothetical protein
MKLTHGFAGVAGICTILCPMLLFGEDPIPLRPSDVRKKLTSLNLFQNQNIAETTTGGGRFPSFDAKFPPAGGTTVFQLSQDYPILYDVNEKFPWADIDFRKDWRKYLEGVKEYCMEGNVEVKFKGQDNSVRKWYHAPWMHDDSEDVEGAKRQGRECYYGLTRERRSRAKELHPLQATDKIQNWAVSLYSPRGGYTLGRIWNTPDGFPDPTNATFPDNTVCFKLLFTAAEEAEVPYLAGSYTVKANINPDGTPPSPFKRVDRDMRLLQVDVAIKEPRVGATSGWIFGTFVYDGSQSGKSPFQRLVPVGLSWGDEVYEKSDIDKEGAFVNERLKESILNRDLIPKNASDNNWGKKAYVTHHGLGGRLNGPVDNKFSSCMSCHGRAGTYYAALPPSEKSGFPMPILAGKDAEIGSATAQKEAFAEFFRPIRPNSHLEQGAAFGQGEQFFVSVDFSLQVSQGIRNFYQNLRTQRNTLTSLGDAFESTQPFTNNAATLPKLPNVSRGGDD